MPPPYRENPCQNRVSKDFQFLVDSFHTHEIQRNEAENFFNLSLKAVDLMNDFKPRPMSQWPCSLEIIGQGMV